MTLGFYENFPLNIHMVESFNSTLSSKQLQQRLIQVLYEINRKEFSFEEAANPTIPECKLIFEFGLADAEGFNYVDEEEVKKVRNLLGKENLRTMDFFCAIRYYKGEKKSALKFDYYLLRTVYNRDILEIQVFHKKGPRYISPEDLTLFIFNKTNEASNRKILKKTLS
ncbi:MAG: hypothetical protein ABSC20_03005 [Candidatus Bathyarchaeia archaeon]